MTTTAVYEKILIFGFFELYKAIYVQKAQENGKDGSGKSKFKIFFKIGASGRKNFLGPN